MKGSSLRRRRARLGIVALLFLAGGLGWAYYADYHLPYWHFRTVAEGRFYRTSQLDEEQLGAAIRDYGIRTIVNLRDVAERGEGDWYETERRVAAEQQVRLLDLPLAAGTPPSPEQVDRLLAVLDDPQNLPVLVHCYHGSIRSAAAEGLFRREYLSEGGDRALRRVESWGRDLGRDYPQIARFIREYVPRRERQPLSPHTP